MKIIKGTTLTPSELIQIKPSYTISKALNEDIDITLFSFGKDTDIGSEKYETDKLYILLSGNLFIDGKNLFPGSLIYISNNIFFEITSISESVLLELTLKEENMDTINNIVKGKVLELGSLIEVIKDSIANKDLVSRSDLKIVLMSFDKGQALGTHTAPGDALVIALEGEAELTMNGISSRIKAGEQFVFEKKSPHSVKAITEFKMCLILVK